jgi:PAS domain S-box-containing protein
MLAEILQDRAALYVSGAMTAPERESFEVLLEYHQELRALVTGLQEVAAGMILADVKPAPQPPPAMKSRILHALEVMPPRLEAEGMVVTDAAGQIEWVNSAFTAMCGYSLDELRGRKPGHLLQGPETDPAAVERIRGSLRARRSLRETLVNYHKDGTRYRADIRIAPILDDAGRPLYFVARERKLDAEAVASN